MADLRININGSDNASPAMSSAAKGIREAGDEAEKAKEKFKIMGNTMLELGVAGAAVVKLGVDAVKAFEEQAKADRQLQSVAGNLTDTFKAQATALQGSLGVSDDMVERLQTMLLKFGEAPAQVDKTVRALLDYSTFTGTDVVANTRTMIMAVESGREAFKDAGLQYDKTGEKSKDVVAIGAALAKQYGGAAAGDADTVSGAARRTAEQFHEVQETFGGMIAVFTQKTGVLEKLRDVLGDINKGLGGDAKFNRDKEWASLQSRFADLNVQIERAKAGQEDWDSVMMGGPAKDANKLIEERAQVVARINAIEAEGRKQNAPLPDVAPGDQLTMRQKEKNKAHADEAKKHAEEMQKIYDKNAANAHKDFEEARDLEEGAAAFEARTLNARLEESNRFAEEAEKIRDIEDKKLKEHLLEQQRMLNDLAKAEKAAHDADEKEWADAGARIGTAFVSSLGDALEQLAAGGDVDAAEQVGNILASVLSVAGGVIGGILGSAVPGLGTAGGAMIGGAIGGLAGQGVKAATRRHRHDGGWAGDEPRYHSGAWVGTDEESAILQSGERVLSRPEVQAMGGPSGVDAATRGGGRGGINVTVQTLDGSTAREYFERAGGRALLNAVRTGRGAPSLLFGDR